jgi:hypothetical protein
MNWISQNLEAVLLVGLVVWWLGQVAGPGIKAKWPAIKEKLTAKNLTLPVVAGILALKHFSPAVLPPVDPVHPQRVPDLVDRCGITGRSLLADALVDFSRQSFATDQAKEDAINNKIHDVIEASFVPLNDEIAQAMKAGRLVEIAEKIRQGNLHD